MVRCKINKKTIKIQSDDILKKLKKLSSHKNIEGMARFGINPKKAFNVSIPNLRKLAKEIGRDHIL
ncbi:DNA alkylation repair protein [Candidatus Kuenenbacteria bacterium]|nr:DNA alkylation repair protein [Candidatus Kuenenbacteria bacterium]